MRPQRTEDGKRDVQYPISKLLNPEQKGKVELVGNMPPRDVLAQGGPEQIAEKVNIEDVNN
jgi:hypothetical protein